MSDHYGKCEKCGRLSGINDNLICFECRDKKKEEKFMKEFIEMERLKHEGK